MIINYLIEPVQNGFDGEMCQHLKLRTVVEEPLENRLIPRLFDDG